MTGGMAPSPLDPPLRLSVVLLKDRPTVHCGISRPTANRIQTEIERLECIAKRIFHMHSGYVLRVPCGLRDRRLDLQHNSTMSVAMVHGLN